MKNALNNSTAMISATDVDSSEDWLERKQDAMDAAQAEEDAQERDHVEYANALITFGDLVDSRKATVEELNDALDSLMNAALHHPHGQEVVSNAEECVENSIWRIEWSAVNRIVPRLPTANPTLERLALANVSIGSECDTPCIHFDVLVDGKNVGGSLEWLDEDGDLVRDDGHLSVNREVIDDVVDALCDDTDDSDVYVALRALLSAQMDTRKAA
jgi:hypothetical protein